MYDFSHFLHKPEKHDVTFVAACGASATFCKMLLVSLSEVWRSREDWPAATDAAGRVCHDVENPGPVENAQEVLDVLQAAVFTGKLSQHCSCKVLLQVARLADAELMPTILDSTAAALQSSSMDDVLRATKDAPEQACRAVLEIDSTAGHVQHPALRAWVCRAAEQLVEGMAGQIDPMASLLNELPANSIAALGVIKAGWTRMPHGRLPEDRQYSRDQHYNKAIVRHSQIILDNPSRDFLSTCHPSLFAEYRDPLIRMLSKMSHKILGPPSAALASDAAFESWWSQVFQTQPIQRLWLYYIQGPDLDYLRLINRVNVRNQAIGYVLHRPQDPCRDTIARMCGGCEHLMQMSASELQFVVLPVLRSAARGDRLLVAAVEALARVKGQLQQQEDARESDELDSRPRKRVRQDLVG